MRKDIEMPEIEGVEIAIAREYKNGEADWKVYIINHNDYDLDNVMVSSKGYGEMGGEEKKTSMLRHFIGTVKSQSFQPIETIIPDLFFLTNEYWVSFYAQQKLFDHKFIFSPGTVEEQKLQPLKILELEGVLCPR